VDRRGQRTMSRLLRAWVLCLAMLGVGSPPSAQVHVTGQVILLNRTSGNPLPDASQVVVWLTAPSGAGSKEASQPRQELRLVQRHKSFEPHLLVVQAGSLVQFPNDDPFFHNVFSLFQGQRFDLGLYEAGSTRSVLFDKPGICYLFCNIHPEMSAVVVVLKTPYYAISDRAGQFSISAVPPGRYELDLWNERSLVEDLKSLTRQVDISESANSLGTIPLRANPNQTMTHKNKYGRDYDNPTPPSSLYTQP
jgi:plastocyanin